MAAHHHHFHVLKAVKGHGVHVLSPRIHRVTTVAAVSPQPAVVTGKGGAGAGFPNTGMAPRAASGGQNNNGFLLLLGWLLLALGGLSLLMRRRLASR
jgi:hypothetical protein